MSRILDKLHEAEEQRQRVIAERKRLEAEADAALAAHDREARPRPQADPPQPAISSPAGTPHSRYFPWGWAAVALAFLVVAVFVLPERTTVPTAPGPVPAQARPVFDAGLKLDRDLEAFAARVRATEKP